MSLTRNLFLKASESVWLRQHVANYVFMHRSVARFLPGEGLEDALGAARVLTNSGIFPVFAHLGENVAQRAEAEQATCDYVSALTKIREAGFAAQISVKLTQLGLDLGANYCRDNLKRILENTRADDMVWIDMEHSPYVDVTLDIYRQVHETHQNTGICLQAYLFRTESDLESLLPLGPSIRLVKGAYKEPPEIAFAEKADVDANFFELAKTLLTTGISKSAARCAIATHDKRLIAKICAWAAEHGLANPDVEFQMLFGIQRPEQIQLAAAGYRSGAFISYGSYWFPWFMRRLAERPANVFFVVRNLFSR